MNNLKISCAHALVGQEWRDDVVLGVDEAGMIRDVRQHQEETPGEWLSGFVVPGMPNVHSHGFQQLIAGLAAPGSGQGQDSFWSWRQAMYALATSMGPAEYQVCLSWVYLYMLKSGFTSCAEFHYLHHQADGTPFAQKEEMSLRIIAAAEKAGMPLTLLPVLYQHAGFGEQAPEQQQRRFVNSLDGYLDLLDRLQKEIDTRSAVRLGIAPHSLRAVPRNVIRALDEAVTEAMPRHMHIAEQSAEVRESIFYLGARPIEWLADEVDLDEHWTLIHATHAQSHELERLARRGVSLGLCPMTEADLGDGLFPVDDWLEMDGKIAVGSDSNVRISPAGELRQLEWGERLRTGRRNVLARRGHSVAETLYARCCSAGATAINQPCGLLSKGLRADLVELDEQHPLLRGCRPEQVLERWVFSGGEDMIKSVWVAGKPVVVNGKHPAEDDIQSKYLRLRGRIGL